VPHQKLNSISNVMLSRIWCNNSQPWALRC